MTRQLSGGSDRRPWGHIPSEVGCILDDPAYVWQAHTEPEPDLFRNRAYWPSGRVMFDRAIGLNQAIAHPLAGR